MIQMLPKVSTRMQKLSQNGQYVKTLAKRGGTKKYSFFNKNKKYLMMNQLQLGCFFDSSKTMKS